MKKQILFFVMLLVLGGLMTVQSCKEEEGVLTTYGAFTRPVLVAPANDVFIDVTGTTVDLTWSSTDADGDPQKWDIYFGDSDDPDLVESNYTTQTYTATVAKGVEYFWRVVGTDANGVPTRSETWSFKVIDPAAPLDVTMDWSTNVLDVIGMTVDPLTVANLRLKIRKSDLSALSTVNTAEFETYSFLSTLADGKYYIATDLTATIDAGDFNAPIDLDINLTFNQLGTVEKELSFPAVMTNRFACSTYTVYLASVVKAGNTYTIEPYITYPQSTYSAVWYGTDNTDFEYESEVETYMGCSLQIQGLSYGWMSDYWGEVIVKGGFANITISGGIVTIPNQFYCRTKWNGAVQPDYYIEGTGTYDASGPVPVMTITYDLIQNGVSMASQSSNSDPAFVAHLTQDPAGLKGGKGTTRPIIEPAKRK